jgi:prolyl oligopeptidase
VELGKFPQDELSSRDRLSVRLLDYQLRQELEAFDLETYLLRVTQVFGLHNKVYTTVDRMPAHTLRDYQNIIARLHAVPAYVDQNIALLDEASRRGLVQPKVVVDLVHDQISAQAAQDQATTPLLLAFRRFPSSFPADQQAKLGTEAIDAYEKEFLPSWHKLLDYINGPYARSARASVGLGSIPGGRQAYTVLVRRYTTTSMTPEEIHKIGEAEVKRIEGEMQAVMRETGFNGTLEEFEKKLQASPDQHFRSKDEMLVYCRNIAKIIEPELPAEFKNIPVLLYGVRAIPPDREAATPTHAQPPSPDNSTPGWFNLNTYQPEKQSRMDKESLVLHEAVPGHIFQISLAHSLKALPEFRKFYTNSAYVEGWALYAESLGPQLGMYRDPYSRFGELASERFRAVRLVVDTGIHALGWTREQAVDYFRAHAPEESLAEVDRYISWPGQALAYKVGQLKIRELRSQAEQRLGPKFDVRDFHDVILRNGVLPLDLLQEEAQAYLNSAK